MLGILEVKPALLLGGFDHARLLQVDSKTAEFETELSQVLLEARNIQPTNIKVEVRQA